MKRVAFWLVQFLIGALSLSDSASANELGTYVGPVEDAEGDGYYVETGPHHPLDITPAPIGWDENGYPIYPEAIDRYRFDFIPPSIYYDDYLLGSATELKEFDPTYAYDQCEGLHPISSTANLRFNNLGSKSDDREAGTGCETAANPEKAMARAQEIVRDVCSEYCRVSSGKRGDSKTVPKVVGANAIPHEFTPASACTTLKQTRLQALMQYQRGTRFVYNVRVECTEALQEPAVVESSTAVEIAPLVETVEIPAPADLQPMDENFLEAPAIVEDAAPSVTEYVTEMANEAYDAVVDFAASISNYVTDWMQEYYPAEAVAEESAAVDSAVDGEEVVSAE